MAGARTADPNGRSVSGGGCGRRPGRPQGRWPQVLQFGLSGAAARTLASIGRWVCQLVRHSIRSSVDRETERKSGSGDDRRERIERKERREDD